MRRGLVGLLVPVILAMAGCAAGSGAGPAESSAPEPVPSPPGSTRTPPPTVASGQPGSTPPAGGGVLVEFSRRGGFAGLSDQLVVRQDGGFTLVRLRPPVTRSGQLDAAELAELRRVLAESGFAQLPTVQATKGSDLFTYQVTYQGGRIVATDGAVAAPLRPVLATLSGIVARHGS